MEIKRLLTNVCSGNLEESKKFYTSIFSFKVDYDSDWFVHLISEGRELELGIIHQNHEVVPEATRGAVSGVYLTFVVDDVHAMYESIEKSGYKVLQYPTVTNYGQNRMLVLAPEGTVCDISSPTKA